MKKFTTLPLSIALLVSINAVAADNVNPIKLKVQGNLFLDRTLLLKKPVVDEPVVDKSIVDKPALKIKPAEFLDAKFAKVPFDLAPFNSDEQFTPLDELSTAEYTDDEEMAPKRRAFDLSAVEVTPEGESFVSEVSTEDFEIFDKAMDYISSANEGIVSAEEANKKLSLKRVALTTDNEVAGDRELVESDVATVSEGEVAESVIGVDERVRVNNTTAYPFRTMGRIDIGCTGTLIGPRHVLTAGHCVYNINTNSWYSSLSFSPGQNGSYRPYGKIGWSKAISVKGWTQSHSKSYDYAMIVLKEPIGYTTGWLGYGYKNGWWTMNVNVNGYPADKAYGTMWHEFCPMSTIWYNSRRVTHTCDTYGGMSGSALYRYLNGSRIIYAVHAYGSGGGSSNSGTRINSEVFNNLKNWKAQNP